MPVSFALFLTQKYINKCRGQKMKAVCVYTTVKKLELWKFVVVVVVSSLL